MNGTLVVFRREFAAYFLTPLAYVFLAFFLVLTGIYQWAFMGFYSADQASLQALFGGLPWLFLALIPALGMRLWSEERHSGTIELLLTLPISVPQAVLGKFLAAWAFVGVALTLLFSEWATVTYLGEPDHGVIAASFMGAFLMAGGFLAFAALISSLTKNQVLAFVVTLVLLLINLTVGFPGVADWLGSVLPATLHQAIKDSSFLVRFDAISRGVLDLRDVLFFLSAMALCLFANASVIDLRKGA
jgi:ABC-2 type transport system permease protein